MPVAATASLRRRRARDRFPAGDIPVRGEDGVTRVLQDTPAGKQSNQAQPYGNGTENDTGNARTFLFLLGCYYGNNTDHESDPRERYIDPV